MFTPVANLPMNRLAASESKTWTSNNYKIEEIFSLDPYHGEYLTCRLIDAALISI